jgi:hypothetical protein
VVGSMVAVAGSMMAIAVRFGSGDLAGGKLSENRKGRCVRAIAGTLNGIAPVQRGTGSAPAVPSRKDPAMPRDRNPRAPLIAGQ